MPVTVYVTEGGDNFRSDLVAKRFELQHALMQLASGLPLEGNVTQSEVLPFPNRHEINIAPIGGRRKLGRQSSAKSTAAGTSIDVWYPRSPALLLHPEASGFSVCGHLGYLGTATPGPADHRFCVLRGTGHFDWQDKIFYRL